MSNVQSLGLPLQANSPCCVPSTTTCPFFLPLAAGAYRAEDLDQPFIRSQTRHNLLTGNSKRKGKWRNDITQIILQLRTIHVQWLWLDIVSGIALTRWWAAATTPWSIFKAWFNGDSVNYMLFLQNILFFFKWHSFLLPSKTLVDLNIWIRYF